MAGSHREASARDVSNLAAQVRSGDDSWLQSVGKQDLESLKTTADEDGRTLLHTIAAVGRLDLLQHVQEHGFMVAVNRADAEGWTPLLSGLQASHPHHLEKHILGCFLTKCVLRCSGEFRP